MKKLIVIFIILFINFGILADNHTSLEVVVPVNIYSPLSKSISTSLPGSSIIIIDSNELEKNKDLPLHTIFDKKNGIKSRSIYGASSSGSKTTIDIRGMGAQAKSNVLILINGQRLNNIDMSEIDIPSLPLESIDRIEIFKGNAASVLYGEGAIGGAINIITNPEINAQVSNEIFIKNGTFKSKEVIWNTSQKLNLFSINTHFNHFETDGYRDENEQLQNNLNSEIRFPGKRGDHFISINLSEQIMSTPSDRSQNQLFTDRRGSDTPDDYINSIGGSIYYGFENNINDFKTLILNGSFRIKDSYSDLQSTSSPSYSDTSLTNYQFTPRINHTLNYFNKISKLTYGLDFQYADYKSYRKENENSIPLHVYDAWQATQSLYFQQSTYINKKTSLGTGMRLQRNSIAIGDHLDTSAPDYAGWQKKHTTLLDEEFNYALNIGIDRSIFNNSEVYSRIGNGFRYPNIDDRIGGSGDTSLELDTQTSQDLEIGYRFNSDTFSTNLSAYIIEAKNELAYDSDAFENININSTRRFGIEFNTKNNISKKMSLNNDFTFAKAKYTSGDQGTYATDFEGNDVPLVPQYSLDSNLEYEFSKKSSVWGSIKYQDDMRMESDDENFQNTKIPSYITTNLNFTYKFGNFISNLLINNIFDEKYHNYAVASSSTQGAYNAYPEPGREILFTIGSKF